MMRLLARCASVTLTLLAAGPTSAQEIDLAGDWSVRLDETGVGEEQAWFTQPLDGQTIHLPGTLDQAGLGHPLDPETMTYDVPVLRTQWPSAEEITAADQAGHLVREHLYLGQAWYQRLIDIPDNWRGKFLTLTLERVMWRSDVWLDDTYLGSCDSLVAPHRYDLGPLAPGKHRLTIRVDNNLIHNIGILGHAYGPETQSRWNGIVGKITLTAHERAQVRSLQVYPDADRQFVRVRASLLSARPDVVNAKLWLAIQDPAGKRVGLHVTDPFVVHPGTHEVELRFGLWEAGLPWDEFRKPLYEIEAAFETWTDAGEATIDRARATFGFRHLEREGRHLRLNGNRLFLRGTLDCAVYPNTGHPPVTVEAWRRILSQIKHYGFNHVRFHTWCPPEAAFQAADELGLYLAPETPFWVDNWSTSVASRPKLLGEDPEVLDYIRREMRRISDAYGNHPSFTFFCIGNEFGMNADWQPVRELLAEIKNYDSRRLYNASTARRRLEEDDFWVTHSTGSVGTRGIGPAHTNWDFGKAAASVDLPLIGHETGQRPVFPDFADLLPKFKGTLRPYNLERHRRSFLETFDASRARDFERASAKFQLVQYKAEHEAMRRTADYAGYQLLMLNDFTGQSEALVGILDPFWESKGVVSADEVRRWNSPTVPLARFDRYLWTTDETFKATIELAHHGWGELGEVEVEWAITGQGERVHERGVLDPVYIRNGTLTELGALEFNLAGVSAPAALTLTVQAGSARNDWKFWVYPPTAPAESDRVFISERFDAETRAALDAGRRVLLLGHGIENQCAARTGFHSVYWSAGWWGNEFSSLGVICEPKHSALQAFPNDGHSDWQWASLTSGATTFLLKDAPRGFEPIVQAVPDFHYNTLLAQVFEAKVGDGRLLVCGYDLSTDLQQRHAARQLRASLLSYMNSLAFDPETSLPPEYLERLLRRREEAPTVRSESIQYSEAQLHIKAAARLDTQRENLAWRRVSDQLVTQTAGYDWRVLGGGTWRDEDGCAWHGNPLTLELEVPRSFAGRLYLHAHDWNNLGRRGTIDIEGRSHLLGPHAGDGKWLVFDVAADDTHDGVVQLVAKPTSGPNIMVTELVFLRTGQ
jgi:Glycosyl hydrolases family 2, TIM barrel domain/Glycosyl hydrolases family 2, sugar binding domain